MKSMTIKIISSLALVIGIFWFGANMQKKNKVKKSEQRSTENFDKLIRPYSPTLGPEGAEVTLVEFLDPECEACGAMYPIVKQLLQEFEGKIRLVVRYMPLHKNSVYAANVLEIARKDGKFWNALEILFSKQNEWASHSNPKPELIKGYMDSLSVDLSPMESIMVNDSILQNIMQDKKDAQALGVRGTPTFFVNGMKLDQIGYNSLKFSIKNAILNKQ